MPKRKRRSAEFKFKVVLEAAKGTKTLSGLSSEYEVHSAQISEWKSQLLKDGVSIFSTTTARQHSDEFDAWIESTYKNLPKKYAKGAKKTFCHWSENN